MRWARNNFKHSAVYASLCDLDVSLSVVPSTPPATDFDNSKRMHTPVETPPAESGPGKATDITPVKIPTGGHHSVLPIGHTLFDGRTLLTRRRKADHQGRPRIYEAPHPSTRGQEARGQDAQGSEAREKNARGSVLPSLDKRASISFDHRAIASAAAACIVP